MADERITREVGTGLEQCATSKGIMKAFEFLKLPPEIRNTIYWHALAKKRYRCLFFQPPLTSVNKQIRSKSPPVLYGNSKFTVCFDDNFLSGDPRKLSRLRKLWEILSPVPAVSPIPSFPLVTKLDILHSFSDATSPDDCVVFHIYMRNKDSDYAGSYKNHLVCRPGWDWKSCANIWTVCYELANSASIHIGWSWNFEAAWTDFVDVDSVIKMVFLFVEKCPAAAELVWVVVEAKTGSRSTLI